MDVEKLIYGAVAVVALVIVFNFISTMEFSSTVDERLAEAKEAAVLPTVELITIGVDCDVCIDLSQLENALLTSLNANFTARKVEYGSQEAKALISKYGIERLPAMIVKGNISVVANSQMGPIFRQVSDALVVEGIPPYVDALSGEKKGIVNAYIVGGCEECYDFTGFIQALASANVYVSSVENLSVDEAPISIEKEPTLLISKDVEEYPQVVQAFAQQGISLRGNYYVVEPLPPYVDVGTGLLRGSVNITYIEKEGCEGCLPISEMKSLVDRLGFLVDVEESLNETSARELISTYGIETLPVVLITGDVQVYERLKEQWPIVGVVLEDALILNNYSFFGDDVGYFNISSAELVKPQFREITVSGTEFSFSPSSITLKEGEKVRITFINTGQAPHDFTLDELGIKTSVLSPGQSETITFTAPASGTFSFYCSVPGHRDAGMEGTLEVI